MAGPMFWSGQLTFMLFSFMIRGMKMPRGVYARASSKKKLPAKTKKVSHPAQEKPMEMEIEEIAVLGKRIWEEQKSILHKALSIVGPADRGQDYGHPLDNFTMEAELMNVWLKHRKTRINNTELDWQDIAVSKLFTKITRAANLHKEDNLVDIAGYAWCWQEAFQELWKRRDNDEK
jgi:hypothetical protein